MYIYLQKHALLHRRQERVYPKPGEAENDPRREDGAGQSRTD
jgi:hypothetical protein